MIMESKRAFPLWETKYTYVQDLREAQRLLIRYRDRGNPRDFVDMQSKSLQCWMNIRKYRDLLEKKKEWREKVETLEKLVVHREEHKYEWWAEVVMFLDDAYKRLGIDDVGKRDDDEDYKTAVLDGLFG